MSDTESQKVSKYLFTIIEGIKKLREGGDNVDSPRFEAWHFGTMKKIERVFGRESLEMNHFLAVKFKQKNRAQTYGVIEDHELEDRLAQFFHNGLDQTQEMVMAMLEEINLMGVPETAQTPVETIKEEPKEPQTPMNFHFHNSNSNNNSNTNTNTLTNTNEVYIKLSREHGADQVKHLEALVEELNKNRNEGNFKKVMTFLGKMGYDATIQMLPTLAALYFPSLRS